MWKDYFKGILNSENFANGPAESMEHSIDCKENYLGLEMPMCSFVSLASLLQKLSLNKAPGSEGFTHRPNRPWPRAPRFWGPHATPCYDDSLLKFAKLRRGITSQFTLKQAKMQMSRNRPLSIHFVGQGDEQNKEGDRGENSTKGAKTLTHYR